MINCRKYGNSPFRIAVIHGGPGTAGELAPVARQLSINFGVIEPLQSKSSIEELIQEMHTVLNTHGNRPITLIGHSWGAWLSLIFTARFKTIVNKLIIIGGASFEKEFTKDLAKTRLERLNRSEILRFDSLLIKLNDPDNQDKDTTFKQIGNLISKADTCRPINDKNEICEYNYNIFQNVWKEAEKLRDSGELLKLIGKVNCPVIAIHGDNDSHPYEGVRQPLSRIIKDFKFIKLNKCGHNPWNELYAKDKFYDILRSELTMK